MIRPLLVVLACSMACSSQDAPPVDASTADATQDDVTTNDVASVDSSLADVAADADASTGLLSCPLPGDPRIAPVAPYTSVMLDGTKFANGAVATWSWSIVGNDPCDVLYASPAHTPAGTATSFSLTNATASIATASFPLSGDYAVTLVATDAAAQKATCTWTQSVKGPGVRVELCWDHEGTAVQGGADLDLHVHRSGTTTAWSTATDDCYYANCDSTAYDTTQINWGYAQTPLANCSGTPTGNQWTATPGKDCYDPRLDDENVSSVGVAENTNIDNPKNGDSFRVMVSYYGQDNGQSKNNVEQHPIVAVYCGGALAASFGVAPNQLSGFNVGAGDPTKGLMWRVADVAAQVSGNGDTTGCTVTPIHPPNSTTGYYVTNNVTTY